MSFSRIQYDVPEYDSKVLQSTSPFSYEINPNQTLNPYICNPDVTINYGERYAYTNSDANMNTIDIDNYLSARRLKLNHHSLNIKEEPFEVESAKLLSNQKPRYECNNLTNSNTLLSNPKSFYRGLTTQHLVFIDLDRNPQDSIPYQYPPFAVSSRDVVKKTYQNYLCSQDKKKYQMKHHYQLNIIHKVVIIQIIVLNKSRKSPYIF